MLPINCSTNPNPSSCAKHWSAKMEECKPSEISSSKMFEGYNKRYKHFSPTLGCSMTFHIYFPPSPSPSHKLPVSLLYPLLFFHFQILKFHTQIEWVFHPILTALVYVGEIYCILINMGVNYWGLCSFMCMYSAQLRKLGFWFSIGIIIVYFLTGNRFALNWQLVFFAKLSTMSLCYRYLW